MFFIPQIIKLISVRNGATVMSQKSHRGSSGMPF